MGPRDLAWPEDLLSPLVAFADGSDGREIVARESQAVLKLRPRFVQEGKGVSFTFAGRAPRGNP